MDPRMHAVFQLFSEEMKIIIDASVAKVRTLGNPEVTPLHVIDRILDFHSGMLCHDRLQCPRCSALKLCISAAVSRIPVTNPTRLNFSRVLVMSVRLITDNLRGGRVPHMEDVQQLLSYLLDDTTVRNVIGEAGFSISEIKNNVENGGTVSNCNV